MIQKNIAKSMIVDETNITNSIFVIANHEKNDSMSFNKKEIS